MSGDTTAIVSLVWVTGFTTTTMQKEETLPSLLILSQSVQSKDTTSGILITSER